MVNHHHPENGGGGMAEIEAHADSWKRSMVIVQALRIGDIRTHKRDFFELLAMCGGEAFAATFTAPTAQSGRIIDMVTMGESTTTTTTTPQNLPLLNIPQRRRAVRLIRRWWTMMGDKRAASLPGFPFCTHATLRDMSAALEPREHPLPCGWSVANFCTRYLGRQVSMRRLRAMSASASTTTGGGSARRGAVVKSDDSGGGGGGSDGDGGNAGPPVPPLTIREAGEQQAWLRELRWVTPGNMEQVFIPALGLTLGDFATLFMISNHHQHHAGGGAKAEDDE
jgi:hypothetical protein